MDDRRKYPRFQLKNRVQATLKPERARLGQISDICQGGLSFSYITTDDWDSTSSAVDIRSEDGRFDLQDFPCRTVYDVETKKIESGGLLQQRRHGLAFEELEPDHLKNLKAIIETYATSLV